MQTIQHYFKEADIDELVNSYIFEYPLTFKPSDDVKSDKTIADAYASYENSVRGLVERIRTIDSNPNQSDGDMVFFVHHCTEHDGDSLCVTLAKISDILDESKRTESYGYEFSPLAETVGYYVADTYLTQRNVNMVLVDFMFESSFFGFEQEGLDDAVSRLEEAIDEAERNRDDPDGSMTFEELAESIGWEPEKRDPEEKEAWHKLIGSEIEYNTTACLIEERKIREMLNNG